MSKLKNLKSVPIKIAEILNKDERIKELLSIKNVSLIEEGVISLRANEISGIKEDSYYATKIIIIIDTITFVNRDKNIILSGSIFVINANSELTDNRELKTLTLADLIIDDLDNLKLNAAGEIKVNGLNFIAVNKTDSGYRISFTCTDQENKEVEL